MLRPRSIATRTLSGASPPRRPRSRAATTVAAVSAPPASASCWDSHFSERCSGAAVSASGVEVGPGRTGSGLAGVARQPRAGDPATIERCLRLLRIPCLARHFLPGALELLVCEATKRRHANGIGTRTRFASARPCRYVDKSVAAGACMSRVRLYTPLRIVSWVVLLSIVVTMAYAFVMSLRYWSGIGV